MDQRQFNNKYQEAEKKFTTFLLEAILSRALKIVIDKNINEYIEIKKEVRNLIIPIDHFDDSEKEALIDLAATGIYNTWID